jgi:hypothetical protein
MEYPKNGSKPRNNNNNDDNNNNNNNNNNTNNFTYSAVLKLFAEFERKGLK